MSVCSQYVYLSPHIVYIYCRRPLVYRKGNKSKRVTWLYFLILRLPFPSSKRRAKFESTNVTLPRLSFSCKGCSSKAIRNCINFVAIRKCFHAGDGCEAWRDVGRVSHRHQISSRTCPNILKKRPPRKWQPPLPFLVITKDQRCGLGEPTKASFTFILYLTLIRGRKDRKRLRAEEGKRGSSGLTMSSWFRGSKAAAAGTWWTCLLRLCMKRADKINNAIIVLFPT